MFKEINQVHILQQDRLDLTLNCYFNHPKFI